MWRLRARWLSRSFGRRNERLLLPPTHGVPGRARPDDYRRVVSLLAGLVVGFFFPALVLAGVPPTQWPTFALATAAAGGVIASTFLFIPQGSRAALVAAGSNALIAAGLAPLYGGYYHQLPLAFMLIVAAHAIVHGFRAAFGAVLLGTVLIPLVIERPMSINSTDFVYAFFYLLGAALIPWTAGRLAERRAVALKQQLTRTERVRRETVLILARAAEARDGVTGEHINRVGDLSLRLGERAGLDTPLLEELRYAAMLHDVGKLHIPDRILLKPGPLDPEEWALVRRHTLEGERILGSSDGFALARRVARWHHENWDGSGYPDGLSREAIPFEARIVRLVDVFDALAHDRPYKTAWPVERIVDELRRQRGRHFDPGLLDLFEETLENELRALPAVPVVRIGPAMPEGAPAGRRHSPPCRTAGTGGWHHGARGRQDGDSVESGRTQASGDRRRRSAAPP